MTSFSLNSSSSFDPTTVATNLATAAVQNQQQLLNSQNQTVQGTNQALGTLQGALSTFNSALLGLSSLPGQSVSKYSAALVDTTLGSATANSSAVPGSYSVGVQQLATQGSLVFANVGATIVPSPPTSGSTITITLANHTQSTIVLSATGGSMTASDIARAINQQANGVAMATVVNGTDSLGNPVTQLTLTSGVSGAQGAIASIGFVDNTGTNQSNPLAMSGATTGVTAQDAKATINGLAVQQSSNTITAIPGVTLTLTAAQAAGAAPTTLTVARDNTATDTQVQNFVNAYNTIKKSLDSLTAIGADGSASGVFANDSGLHNLQSNLSNALRQTFNGVSLMKLGVSADQNGNLSLDTTKLNNLLNTNPTALDSVFGNASVSAPSGLLGSLSKIVSSWNDPVSGQIQQRQQSQTAISKSLAQQQTQLTNQYNDAYKRYLGQFTRLQTLQAQMSQTMSMFG